MFSDKVRPHYNVFSYIRSLFVTCVCHLPSNIQKLAELTKQPFITA